MRFEIFITGSRRTKDVLKENFSRFAVRSDKDKLQVISSITDEGIILRVARHHLDALLKIVAAVLSEIEEQYRIANFDIRVRDIHNSEPPACGAQFCKPFDPVPGITLVPWQAGTDCPAGQNGILLDPAHSFGTGRHPSTQLCLSLMQKMADLDSYKSGLTGAAVLDIGCGSAILSIVACRLGAAHSTGAEIDPDAVQAARQNIHANSLADTIDIQEMSWQTIEGHYDLVLANLVPSVLCKAARRVPSLLNRNGHAIVAGFRAGQTEYFQKIFQENNLTPVGDYTLNGWGALLLSNKEGHSGATSDTLKKETRCIGSI